MSNFLIRQIPTFLYRKIRKFAASQNLSTNQAVLKLLEGAITNKRLESEDIDSALYRILLDLSKRKKIKRT